MKRVSLGKEEVGRKGKRRATTTLTILFLLYNPRKSNFKERKKESERRERKR